MLSLSPKYVIDTIGRARLHLKMLILIITKRVFFGQTPASHLLPLAYEGQPASRGHRHGPGDCPGAGSGRGVGVLRPARPTTPPRAATV